MYNPYAYYVAKDVYTRGEICGYCRDRIPLQQVLSYKPISGDGYTEWHGHPDSARPWQRSGEAETVVTSVTYNVDTVHVDSDGNIYPCACDEQEHDVDRYDFYRMTPWSF